MTSRCTATDRPFQRVAETARLPVWATVKRAYGLLWDHRRLHAKAVWPPIVFLVAAEFIFHKTVGDARGLDGLENALSGASWYKLAAIGMLWLAGLKFLLSFSISWRRHVMLEEEFDPFFFKKPFWLYLIRLVGIYTLSVIYAVGTIFSILTIVGIVFFFRVSFAHAMSPKSDVVAPTFWQVTDILPYVFVFYLCICSLVALRRIMYLNNVILKNVSDFGVRTSILVIRGSQIRYLAVWLLAMFPIVALTQLLSLANHVLEIDVAATPVALAESAFRQACLFIHFSLGASIGMMTYAALVQGRGPETIR